MCAGSSFLVPRPLQSAASMPSPPKHKTNCCFHSRNLSLNTIYRYMHMTFSHSLTSLLFEYPSKLGRILKSLHRRNCRDY